MIFKQQESLHVRRLKKIAESMAVGTGIIMFWRGVWVLADTYMFPTNLAVSGTISLLTGILILLLTRTFVKQFLGEIQDKELRAEKTMFEKIISHSN